MSSNQILSMILLVVYATLHKAMPVMNFNDGNFIAMQILTSCIMFIICFKLVK